METAIRVRGVAKTYAEGGAEFCLCMESISTSTGAKCCS